jgi:hypothetical protein
LFYTFKAPEHKEATYSQCSRLYAAAIKRLPEDEVIITSDVDMGVFGEYLKQYDGNIQLFGADLLEGEKMYPMCYCSATVGQWKEFMNIGDKTYQLCLDDMLGDIDCEHMRGNYWCADQEKLFNSITTSIIPTTKHNRAKLPERFATLRYDRDDFFILNRLNNDTVDYHMNRPGYEPQNFEIILKIFQYHYPNDGFDWMIDFTNKYKELL